MKSAHVYKRSLLYFRDDLGPIVWSLIVILLMNFLNVIWPVPMAIFFNLMTDKPTDDNWLFRLFAWVPKDRSVRMVVTFASAMLVLRLLNEFLRTLQTQLSIGIGYRGRDRKSVV